ncbi:hypothetical protein FPCIR_885 [Fusarium pseudocircinatum]|uniref:Uncharacterized protein n=1 Tax=Fusarium pseudocircinatum TaxID=56676 RepID=A0A8H5V0Y3_9HYPO|nr:hypothetical protein FPCIR_885 [Fusarium pseudocircinatum]
MHIPSLLFSILGVVSIAAAIPLRVPNPHRVSNPHRVPKLVRPIPVLQKLDENADEDSLRYQPALYFHKNSRHHTAAIYRNGTINPGITPWREYGEPQNVYTRKRCNNGWCAYMYEYYFEVSIWESYPSEPAWENVVVFVKNNAIQLVAAPARGEYNRTDKPLLRDGHPLVAYRGRSRGFQFADKRHVEMVKEDHGEWVTGDLVGWHGFPTPELRKKLATHDFGTAKFHLADEPFGESLKKAAGKYVPGFNCQMDETPGMDNETQEKVKIQDNSEVQENEQKNEIIEEKDSNKKFDIKEKQNKKEDKKEDKKKDKKKNFDIKEKEKEKKFDIKDNVKDKGIKNENGKDKEENKKGDEKEDEKQLDIKKQKDEDK